MNPKNETYESGRLLGTVLIGVLLSLLAAAFIAGMSTERPAPPGSGPVFMGMFLVALGLMFSLSYFMANKSFFLRWLLNFSTGFPKLADKRMAFFLSAICVFSGIAAIADGLGLPFP